MSKLWNFSSWPHCFTFKKQTIKRQEMCSLLLNFRSEHRSLWKSHVWVTLWVTLKRWTLAPLNVRSHRFVYKQQAVGPHHLHLSRIQLQRHGGGHGELDLPPRILVRLSLHHLWVCEQQRVHGIRVVTSPQPSSPTSLKSKWKQQLTICAAFNEL